MHRLQGAFNRDLVIGTFTAVFVAVLAAFLALWVALALVLGTIELAERIS